MIAVEHVVKNPIEKNKTVTLSYLLFGRNEISLRLLFFISICYNENMKTIV